MLQLLIRSEVSKVASEVVGHAGVEEPESTRHFAAISHFSLTVHTLHIMDLMQTNICLTQNMTWHITQQAGGLWC